MESPKRLTKYKCARCGTTIGLYITPSAPPECAHNYRFGRHKLQTMDKIEI